MYISIDILFFIYKCMNIYRYMYMSLSLSIYTYICSYIHHYVYFSLLRKRKRPGAGICAVLAASQPDDMRTKRRDRRAFNVFCSIVVGPLA